MQQEKVRIGVGDCRHVCVCVYTPEGICQITIVILKQSLVVLIDKPFFKKKTQKNMKNMFGNVYP